MNSQLGEKMMKEHNFQPSNPDFEVRVRESFAAQSASTRETRERRRYCHRQIKVVSCYRYDG